MQGKEYHQCMFHNLLDIFHKHKAGCRLYHFAFLLPHKPLQKDMMIKRGFLGKVQQNGI